MYLVTFISLLFDVLFWAVLGRSLISWVDPQARWPITRFLFDVTEPVLAPIRRILPQTGFLDLSAFVVLVLIQILKPIVLGFF